MLTINADSHVLMSHFHKPTDEKRIIVILPTERYQDWLESGIDARDFLQAYPADQLKVIVPEAR
jgi:putative SOS response-associated peptidase YedK